MKKLLNVVPYLNGIGATTLLIGGIIGMIISILGIPEAVCTGIESILGWVLPIASGLSLLIGATMLIEKYMNK